MERDDSPDVSPSHRSFTGNAIPDDMVRPISASESAVLSRFQPPQPAPTGMPQAQKSFVTLPPFEQSPPKQVRPESAKASTGRTLKQQVSRLFGSSELSSSSERRFSHKTENERRDINQWEDDDFLHTPPSEEYWHEEEPTTPVRKTDRRPTTNYDEESSPTPSPRQVDAKTKALRRRTHGPHSSNRHQTLQDALRQLETENNGLSYQDIMRYIGPDNGEVSSNQQQEKGEEGEEEGEEAVERPWQPDTWHERPRVHHVPHNLNRPSDSNLSTNAPSTRASIRPYVEQAAAFMAGGDSSSISSSESIAAAHNEEEEYDDDGDDDDGKRVGIGIIEAGKHASLASTETDGVHEMVVCLLSLIQSPIIHTIPNIL